MIAENIKDWMKRLTLVLLFLLAFVVLTFSCLLLMFRKVERKKGKVATFIIKVFLKKMHL